MRIAPHAPFGVSSAPWRTLLAWARLRSGFQRTAGDRNAEGSIARGEGVSRGRVGLAWLGCERDALSGTRLRPAIATARRCRSRSRRKRTKRSGCEAPQCQRQTVRLAYISATVHDRLHLVELVPKCGHTNATDTWRNSSPPEGSATLAAPIHHLRGAKSSAPQP